MYPAEAAVVVSIFRRHLKLGSVHRLARELDADGVRSKAWTTLKGRAMGGLQHLHLQSHLISRPSLRTLRAVAHQAWADATKAA